MVLPYNRLIKGSNSSLQYSLNAMITMSMYFLDPDETNCHVTCAWHSQKGNYGDTYLNNLNVVAMFNSRGNMFTEPIADLDDLALPRPCLVGA